MNNYIIIGPRSVGKTTIGKKLARHLNIRFFDLDDIVDKKLKGLDRYIKNHGIRNYRTKEHEILKKFLDGLPRGLVLAVGGGTVASQFKPLSRNNIKLLSGIGKIIYLCPARSMKRSIDMLVKNELKRRGDQTGVEIEKLWRLRTPIYETIAYRKIFLDKKKHGQIIKEIISAR